MFEFPEEPESLVHAYTTNDGNYLLIQIRKGSDKKNSPQICRFVNRRKQEFGPKIGSQTNI